MQRVTALFLSLLCLLTAAAAPKWSADVFMLNGSEYRGVPVAKLPEGWDKQIKTVVDNKKNEHTVRFHQQRGAVAQRQSR